MVKIVAWHRHYTRFWKQSMLFCDWAWADFVNPYGPDNEGMTSEGEPKFLNAVTGDDMTFEEGMEIGRRIWNLDRAIWVLQGRHRDMEVFTEYSYTTGAQPGTTTYEAPYVMPVFEDGEWAFKSVTGRMLDRKKVEDWKTHVLQARRLGHQDRLADPRDARGARPGQRGRRAREGRKAGCLSHD